MNIVRAGLPIALLFAGTAAAIAAAPPRVAVLHLAACTYAKLPARCGWLTVPEDRARPYQRQINLRLAIVPAATRSVAAPVFSLEGGPGGSAVDDGLALVRSPLFREFHANRDLVFVDQRGTGGSHPLLCDLDADPVQSLRELFPRKLVQACRDRLSRDADLNMYGSDAAADDLEDLKRSLTYQKIVLFGRSYGAEEALAFLRRHPASVESAVLESVATPAMRAPLPFAQAAQNALDELVRACGANAPCRERFPTFSNDFALLNEGSQAGIPVHVRDGVTHRAIDGIVSHEVFADRIRDALYSPSTAGFLPAVVDQAARHNTVPLGNLMVLMTKTAHRDIAFGEFFSVTCSENVPFISDDDAARGSASTFVGDSRIQAQRAACAIWDVRPASPGFLDPVRSDAPVLMISTQNDPATPPSYGADALKFLPHGKQIVVPGIGHDPERACVTRLEAAFVRAASARGLDESACAHPTGRLGFALTLPPAFAR